MTRHINSLRAFVIAAGLVVCAALAAPSAVHAQSPCACPNVFLKVDPNITCTVTICVKDLSGLNCIPVAPGGGLFPVPCNTVFTYYLLDCYGTYHAVTPTTPVSCICMGTLCCVDAFVVKDINGCWVIKVDPSGCVSC